MRFKIFKPTLIFLCFIAANTYAQNAVIDYAAWNPSNPPCNIFAGGINVPGTLGGSSTNIFHGAVYGQPQFNTIAKSIELPVNFINSSDTRGTQFRLAYSFKNGFTYSVIVNAAEKNSTSGTGFPLNLRLAASNSSGSTFAFNKGRYCHPLNFIA